MKFIPVCSPLLEGNELKYITEAVSTGWISSSGKYVTEFEEAFAAYCDVKHGIAVCNGTMALHLALVALGVGPGDEVIIPNFTMMASALAVCYTGAMPVFADADAKTWNICPKAVTKKITPRTKVIMAVHIYGTPCDMKSLQTIADQYNIILMEDAAEAHGAKYEGKQVGSLSNITGFSFFANKNLTTGEGGMVVTNDDTLAQACRYYKNLCFPLNAPRNYMHEDIGFNYRMSNLHAAIGLAQVERAEFYKKLRIKNGLLYTDLLSSITGVQLQNIPDNTESVYWMNGICLTSEYGKSRTKLIEYLRAQGIDTRLFFNGMHSQPALQKYGCLCDEAYPVSDMLAENGFYLPSSSGLSEEEITYICRHIAKFRSL